jgi:alkylation response protein AidB-like acyl-CoA dehydrogenase
VIALDDRLLALQALTREQGAEFRAHALTLDERPDDVARHLGLEGFRWLSRMLVPPAYSGDPLRVGPHTYDGLTCMERVVAFEQLAYGDAGMVLAAPGPSMSGILVDELASPAQKERYYARILSEPTWTFFALTEPAKGSDAGALETALTGDGDTLRLHGRKRYIGNGTRAALGVVFARARPGPLGIEAVLVEAADPAFSAEPLEMLGLRGALPSALAFDGVEVGADQVLGRHLPATRRGLWGAVMTFNRLRPGIAAAALGVAVAAHDYLRVARRRFTTAERDELDTLAQDIAGVRRLTHRAALEVDAAPANGHLASAVKVHAVALAERSTRTAARLLGPGALLEHPLVEKWLRDARGFDFMEGATAIQKLNVFQGLRRDRLDDA